MAKTENSFLPLNFTLSLPPTPNTHGHHETDNCQIHYGLATRSVKLTNMAAIIGYSVVYFVAFISQTFVVATKTKGFCLKREQYVGYVDWADVYRPSDVIQLYVNIFCDGQ